MKAEHISEHVWSLKAWVIPIHVWIVIEEDGFTLVDAGIPMMAKGIMKFIKQLNAGPLRRILLTHGHSDMLLACVRGIWKSEKNMMYQFFHLTRSSSFILCPLLLRNRAKKQWRRWIR